MKKKSINLIGAGCVNLITAYYLKRIGHELTFFDAAPNPFGCAWNKLGCTWGGEDARMFTLTEADNYNQKTTPLNGESNKYFSHYVKDFGWDVRQDGSNDLEKTWVNHHRDVPLHHAAHHEDGILSFNAESKGLWETMRSMDAELFEGVEFREGIVRVYNDEEHCASQLERHTHLGSLLYNYSTPEKLLAEHPGLGNAIANKNIVGGFKTVGFTVNAHKFFGKLVHWLEQRDVDFHWDEKVERIQYSRSGRIISLETPKRSLKNDNFILSLGAYGSELLQQTPVKGIIGGVLGAWLTIPNVSPMLEHSLKLSRKGHITEDANITIATDKAGNPVLIIGSGYGFTGISPRNIDPAQLELIHKGIENTAQLYFPEAYEKAMSVSTVSSTQKYCIRPWTPTSLGVFENIPTMTGGQCIITGGHNTGGFAQAPSIAQAVIASLNNTPHSMHSLYRDTNWKEAIGEC